MAKTQILEENFKRLVPMLFLFVYFCTAGYYLSEGFKAVLDFLLLSVEITIEAAKKLLM